MVEITSGRLKGRRVSFKATEGLRPTSSKVKMALFSMMQNQVIDSVGLDLFAGTGFVGLEAISRGAKKVHFVENHHRRCAEIRSIFSSWGIDEQAELHSGDARKLLKNFSQNGYSFDWCYLDPPYGSEVLGEVLSQLVECHIVKEGGFIFLEHEEKTHIAMPPKFTELYEEYKTKQYGSSCLSIFQRRSVG